MPTPHVHAELIKAWADGAEIEVYYPNKLEWCTEPNPGWYIDMRYRIKQQPPKKVTRWMWVVKQNNSRMPWINTSGFYTEKEFLRLHTNYKKEDYFKLEWSATEFDK